MKIAAIVPSFYPYQGGGVERVVKNVYNRITERYDLEIDVYSTNSHQKEFLLKENLKVYNYPSLKSLPSRKMIVELRKRIKKGYYDLVHVYNIHNPISIVSLFLPSVPMVISPYYHGRGHNFSSQVAWKTFYKIIANKIFHKQKGVIVNSLYQKKVLIRNFKLELFKFWLIYDGVDTKSIKRSPIPNLSHFKEIDKMILVVSRLEPYKNVHFAIKVLKFLPQEFKLIIVGKGSNNYERELKKEAIKSNLQSRVIFLGFQPDEIVWGLYKLANVFVNFSEVESFGMTCIESIAAGTPVVVNDDKAGLNEVAKIFPEYIQAIRVNNDNLKKLAKLIIDSSEKKPLRINEKILSQFDWDTISEKYYILYTNILNNS